MTPSVRRLVLCLLCLVLVAGACGDDGGGDGESFDEPESAGSDDGDDDGSDGEDGDDDGGEGACALLDEEAVAELLDRELDGSEEEELDDATTSCTWSTAEPSEVVDGPITLTIERGELTDEVAAQIDEALEADGNQVLDLGDASALLCGLGADGDDCDQYDSVAVAVGDTYLEVDLGNWGYPDDYEEDEGVQIMIDAATQATEAVG
jgi:hypothetical protein